MYKITCEPVKDIFGKKTGEYQASFGSFYERGATKQEACDNLNSALDWYFLDIDLPMRHIQTKERIFLLERSFWGYTINWYKIGEKCYGASSCLIGRMSSNKAENELKKYMCSMLEAYPNDSEVF